MHGEQDCVELSTLMYFSFQSQRHSLNSSWHAASQLRKSRRAGLSFNLAAGRILEAILGSKTEGSSTANTKLPSHVLLSHFTRHKLQTFSTSSFHHSLKDDKCYWSRYAHLSLEAQPVYLYVNGDFSTVFFFFCIHI